MTGKKAAKDHLAFSQKALEFRDGDGAFFFAKYFAVFFKGDAADDGSGTAKGFLELYSGSGRVKAKNPASFPGKNGGHVGNAAVAADQAYVSVIHFWEGWRGSQRKTLYRLRNFMRKRACQRLTKKGIKW